MAEIYMPRKLKAADLLDFAADLLLEHEENLKMELEESELILSVYKRAMIAKLQTTTVMIGRCNFPL